MIPEKLEAEWACHLAREELIFLADHGGGWPYVLTERAATPAARRVMLGRMGFQIKREKPRSNGLWVQLDNAIQVCLDDGWVCVTTKEAEGHG